MFQKKSTIKTSVETLVERSRSITELFTSAIMGYDSVNQEAATAIAQKEEAIKNAEAEKVTLEKLVASNTKVVENLRKIFE